MLKIFTDSKHRIAYATDASAYREMPYGVAYPESPEDLVEFVRYAKEKGISIIPRAGGTSLAGQVVGPGLVVDVSRYMNSILEINPQERWIRVEPGVILDDLNKFCKPYGLFFGPETSTSNRCCIGGMVGNNACGSHSLVYGSTRDHLLEAKVLLSDGSEALFKGLKPEQVEEKCKGDSLESEIYREITRKLSDRDFQETICRQYPDPEIRRRNTGYAVDELLDCSYFSKESDKLFNLCRLLAGSEGTLALITELKLNLVPLPPSECGVLCIHCNTLQEAFEANLVALKHFPVAIELMDNTILELSKKNISQKKNRFFVEEDPAAILIVEIAENGLKGVEDKMDRLEKAMRQEGYGYHYSRVFGDKVNSVWALRKAGLGLLSGMPGSAKPVSVVEDTAVAPSKLAAYMEDFKKMMDGYTLECVYHAHIGTGELHLRPVLNLKQQKDRELFRKIALECALLVKKYRGSLSGEHGDGRLRGEFIPVMYGEEIYSFLREVKHLFDRDNIFNPGKIIDSPSMDSNLRYDPKRVDIATLFDFSTQQGWITAIEQCNGSADCRKSSSYGMMCPSYQVTGDEMDTTRARSNILRELLTNPVTEKPFSQKEILEVLSTCLSCKACKSECPSNVDMARFKAEYLQHHYIESKIPITTHLIANLPHIQRLGMIWPGFFNWFVTNTFTSGLLKKMMNFAPRRSIPTIHKTTLKNYIRRARSESAKNELGNKTTEKSAYKGSFYLFLDEFTDYMDVEVGIAFVELMTKLGYEVRTATHTHSGRTEISKGLLKKAKKSADKNVALLKDIISENTPLVGIEPSCILSFRDEYPDLVAPELKEAAQRLAPNTLLYDEFIVREIEKGNITTDSFTDDSLDILLHGHCHQKALASIEPSKTMLSLPKNYKVDIVPSGCCGMAGAFGYEKNNYELSMAVGDNTLFPAIMATGENVRISAPGTSCRQQIFEGTGRRAMHPIEILFNALV